MIKQLKIHVISLVACGLAMLVYGFAVEPNWLEITHHEPYAGRNKLGIRVVQISDLHIHSVGYRERSVHEAIEHLRPDIIVFTGDAIDDPTRLQDLADFMALLPDVPRVGVLGNWEYWSDADLQELKSIYERRSGSRLLVNEVADYDFTGKKLRMLGLDDFTAGQPSQPWQSPKLPADASIVLEHSPGLFDSKDTINRILQGRHDLCLSGHTHSGQVTLFGLALWTPRGSGHFKAGFYDTDHCRLYVSRGIGTSILHLRFGARPELAVFDL